MTLEQSKKITGLASLLGYTVRPNKTCERCLYLEIDKEVQITIYPDLAISISSNSEELLTKILINKLEDIKNGKDNKT